MIMIVHYPIVVLTGTRHLLSAPPVANPLLQVQIMAGQQTLEFDPQGELCKVQCKTS